MSLGADNRHFYKLFFLESIVLGLTGGLIGTAIGYVSSMLFGPLFMKINIGFAEVPIYPIPLAVILSISTCLLASLYPTWRASKIDPIKALRAV
jgi:putative ABC transport system permease protein